MVDAEQEEFPLLSSDDGGKSQYVQVNNYVNLVGRAQEFPSSSILMAYDEATREWIKKRTEIEQDARLRMIDKLIDKDHEKDMEISKRYFFTKRWSQLLTCLAITVITAILAHLIEIGKTIEGFALVFVPLGILLGISLRGQKPPVPEKQKEEK